MASLIRWEPLDDLVSLRDAMDRLFEDSFVRSRRVPAARRLQGLPVDVYETEESVVVKTVIPGVKPEDIDVSITDNVLTIKGETKVEEKVEKDHYICQECRYGSFQRSVALPKTADADQSEASYENGMLTLTVPKKAESKPKTIKVEAKAR